MAGWNESENDYVSRPPYKDLDVAEYGGQRDQPLGKQISGREHQMVGQWVNGHGTVGEAASLKTQAGTLRLGSSVPLQKGFGIIRDLLQGWVYDSVCYLISFSPLMYRFGFCARLRVRYLRCFW